MHDDFPTDPVTLGILVLSALAGVIGYMGNGLRQAGGYFAAALVLGLLTAWFWYSVKSYTEGSSR